MTAIPFDSTNFLIGWKFDFEHQLVDGECCCWRCVLSPARLEEWEELNRKTFGDNFESRWQSGTHYYRAAEFHTRPHRSDQSG